MSENMIWKSFSELVFFVNKYFTRILCIIRYNGSPFDIFEKHLKSRFSWPHQLNCRKQSFWEKNNTSNTQAEKLFSFNYLFLCKCLEWWGEWLFRFLEYGRRLRPVTIICISQEVLRKLTNAYLNFDIVKNFDFGMSYLENMIDFSQTKLLRRIYQIFET